ncbi:hypothetical protein ACFJGV_00515 [Cnuibacter sp. UC19_7]|uniref:hypothetical protein n=1 Tax=Cnuibacter sp. UC19_7 TaxID=3350166 RepID=UPI00366BFACE
MLAIAAIGCVILFMGGMYLMGLFSDAFTFFGGILLVSLALFIAISVIPAQRHKKQKS